MLFSGYWFLLTNRVILNRVFSVMNLPTTFPTKNDWWLEDGDFTFFVEKRSPSEY